MSDTSKFYPRAVYLRNLLVAHVTGRNVNESDYHKLRQYFMGLPETSEIVPKMVVEHADLPGLWHSMRYNYASHEDRKAYVVEQFQIFLDKIAPQVEQDSASVGSAYPLIDEKKLHAVWSGASELVLKSPDVAVQQMKSLVENLCYQLLKNLKVVPDPQQHDLSVIATLTERSLLLSPGKKHYLVIKQLITGCRGTLASIDSFIVDRAHVNYQHSDDAVSAGLILINLYGSLASMLLAAWRVRELLQEGAMQR
ncbi:hypothetical protein [Neptunomonas sp.]|uniref:hypothetical protein n=1 Tax=Neptunomonas sp. TaxID=1971898 RepID=UPI0035686C15